MLMSTEGDTPSVNIGQPFSLDVKGGDKFGVWRMLGDLLYLQMCLQVSTSGGDQTPMWLPSSPKGEIVGIMTHMLSLMKTYLIKIST